MFRVRPVASADEGSNLSQFFNYGCWYLLITSKLTTLRPL